MCGFVGEYLLDERAEVDPVLLARRMEGLLHRGPDALGTWHNRHVGLSHARLTLLDPENGMQPMTSARGTVLSYNGEIYNNTELRAELSAYGNRFHTRSDTEVILAAYDTWGERAWDRLNGMFAFALYDPTREKLYVVRDRLGIKPAYYRITPDGVQFGSEPAAWERLRDANAPLNPSTLIHYLRFAHTVAGSESLFQGLNTLDPGTQLVVEKKSARVERWFQPAQNYSPVSEPEHVSRARLRHLLHLSVGRQMLADAPVGLFLSGGIDSSILAGLLARMTPEPIHSFTIALQGDDDDLQAARTVANRWRFQHRERVISPGEFFSAMRSLIGIRHLPVCYPNEVLIYLLSQEAVREVKAVLTGEGADELFGGYSKILSVLDLYLRAVDAQKDGDSSLMNLLRHEKPMWNCESDLSFFTSVYSWFQTDELRPLLNRSWRDHLESAQEKSPFANVYGLMETLPPWNRFYGLLEYAHLPNLLSRLDGATMAASLEGRVPFTDRDLSKFVFSLPSNVKFLQNCPDKPLLRQTFADLLPPEIQKRPKKPFDASLDRLFASHEGQLELQKLASDERMSEIFDMSALKAWTNVNHSGGQTLKLWLLLSLSMWLNRNIL